LQSLCHQHNLLKRLILFLVRVGACRPVFDEIGRELATGLCQRVAQLAAVSTESLLGSLLRCWQCNAPSGGPSALGGIPEIMD
jgi:hypothetical protein